MSAEIWFEAYHGVAAGTCLHGRCAACDYEGPREDFRVWRRQLRVKVLCNQCSSDISATMRHEGWDRQPNP